ncbi:hypothetical protein D9615_010251 [Tricholomella constricta]|uniref:Uncharacterized protein n=1 Tax=Tricholomella constricta TaxID=117010 RepID=A0A8H5LU49_9AGAR|nr:hypothetical protein D9615_010251 [Tricholomella constricta]
MPQCGLCSSPSLLFPYNKTKNHHDQSRIGHVQRFGLPAEARSRTALRPTHPPNLQYACLDDVPAASFDVTITPPQIPALTDSPNGVDLGYADLWIYVSTYNTLTQEETPPHPFNSLSIHK